jgi:predicted HTH domain antitoxin
MTRSLHEGRRIPAHPDDVRQGLQDAAERRSEARRAEQDALLDLATWLVAAYEVDNGDLSFSEAIKLAGVSRRTAYEMLRSQGVDL